MGALGVISTAWNTVLGQPYHPNAIFLLADGCFFVFGVFLYEGLRRGFTLARSAILAICFAGCVTAIGRSHQNWANPVWLIGMAVLVLSVKLNPRAQELAGPRGATLIRKIGLTTYPLYLLHDFVGWKVMKGLHQIAHLSYESAVLFSALIMLSAAAIIMQYAEPRLAKQISGLLRAKRPAAVPVGSNA
jgi:peptidoglycan/LPS O-acetylase OafA/YrhL